MPTGSFEGNTTRDVASSDRPVGVLANYKALWALLLFGWMWGIAGLLIAVPLLTCLKIIALRVPSWATLAKLLGA